MGKYTHIFKNYEGSYFPGCPVIIVGKALVKEEYTGDIYAQIKFQNIGSKNIAGISASVTVFDVYGKELSSVKGIQYPDMNEACGSEFGSKTLIPLNTSARSFDVRLDEVCFADGSALKFRSGSWEKLPEQELLVDRLGKELAEEYCREISEDSCYVPCKNENIWLCSCGAVNLADEESCRDCGQKYSELVTALDEENLKKAYDEKARKKKKEDDEKHTAERKKRIKIVYGLIGAILAIIITGPIIGLSSTVVGGLAVVLLPAALLIAIIYIYILSILK